MRLLVYLDRTPKKSLSVENKLLTYWYKYSISPSLIMCANAPNLTFGNLKVNLLQQKNIYKITTNQDRLKTNVKFQPFK